MKLKFIDTNNQVSVLAAGDSVKSLRHIANTHHAGSEVLIWRERIRQENNNEEPPYDTTVTDKLANGAYYRIE